MTTLSAERTSLITTLVIRRKLLGLSQAEVARQLGVNRCVIVDLEKGRANSRMGLILAYGRLLRMRFEWRAAA